MLGLKEVKEGFKVEWGLLMTPACMYPQEEGVLCASAEPWRSENDFWKW